MLKIQKSHLGVDRDLIISTRLHLSIYLFVIYTATCNEVLPVIVIVPLKKHSTCYMDTQSDYLMESLGMSSYQDRESLKYDIAKLFLKPTAV